MNPGCAHRAEKSEEYLQLKAAGGDGVNRFGQSSFDQASCRFDPFAIVMLHKRHIRRYPTFGMLFSDRTQFNMS